VLLFPKAISSPLTLLDYLDNGSPKEKKISKVQALMDIPTLEAWPVFLKI